MTLPANHLPCSALTAVEVSGHLTYTLPVAEDDDNGGVDAGVGGDLPAGHPDGLAHDVHAALLVVVLYVHTVGNQ